MARFVKHTSCSSCGSSDAYALYVDDDDYESGHCFSCSYTVPSREYIEEQDGKHGSKSKVRSSTKEQQMSVNEVKSTKPAITDAENKAIKARTFSNGNGGAGLSSSYSGTSTTYSGGGGGGSWSTRANPTAVAAGVDGGGDGSKSASGSAGVANRGGGGGGGGTGASGGNGGSGVVILRYPDSYAAATTTGSPTITVSGGYRIYKFTQSGTITF